MDESDTTKAASSHRQLGETIRSSCAMARCICIEGIPLYDSTTDRLILIESDERAYLVSVGRVIQTEYCDGKRIAVFALPRDVSFFDTSSRTDKIDVRSDLPPLCYHLQGSGERSDSVRGWVTVQGSDFNAQVVLLPEPQQGPGTHLSRNNSISRRLMRIPDYNVQVQGSYINTGNSNEFNPIGGIGPGVDFLILGEENTDVTFVGTMQTATSGAWAINDVQRQAVFELTNVPHKLQVASPQWWLVNVRCPGPTYVPHI